jgi:protein-L-isoaspartate(D-aspartate) O-methyltransferase
MWWPACWSCCAGTACRHGKLGRVLEIGTGCGYQAAVLASWPREVYSIERLRGLHDKARDNLRLHAAGQRAPDVWRRHGGYAKGAPYAAIISAAGGEPFPRPGWTSWRWAAGWWRRWSRANGRQALVVVDKSAQGLKQTLLEAVHFVPLKSGIA